MIIDGKVVAEELIKELKIKLRAGALEKFFGAVLVGSDPASLNFLKQKENTARELGIDFRLYTLPEDITTDGLREEIGRLARPKKCGGCIVQLPLPAGVNRHYALNAIPKEKDVDFLSEAALGAFYTGRSVASPPAVEVVAELLRRTAHTLRDQKVIVIGAGFLIGKPIGFWLQNRVKEVTIFDSSVADVRLKLASADIVISGVGKAGLFGAGDLKDGALVIDFGFNPVRNYISNGANPEHVRKIVGDFDPTGADARGVTYTKTPGGTGPILVSKLYENFYLLNH